MGTQTLILTQEEIRFVAQLVNRAEHEADDARMLSRPDSPQEKAAEADQTFIQGIQAKLAGRTNIPGQGSLLTT